MSLLLAELSDRVDGSAPGATLTLDLSIVPGIATGTKGPVRIASGAVLGSRQHARAGGAILGMKFTIEPGHVTVSDGNGVVVTFPPVDEEEEWVLPAGLTPKQQEELILLLLEDDDD